MADETIGDRLYQCAGQEASRRVAELKARPYFTCTSCREEYIHFGEQHKCWRGPARSLREIAAKYVKIRPKRGWQDG